MTVKSTDNIKTIKESLSLDQIDAYLCNALGSNGYRVDSQGNHIYQTVCHGGDSYKLYYYVDSQMFHCYTHCGDNFDIFELTQRAKNFATFGEAFQYICNFFNIDKDDLAPTEEIELTDDWDILNQFSDYAVAENRALELENKEKKYYPESLLELFPKGRYPEAWLEDGISAEAMEKYNIRMDVGAQKVIIPHYDDEGRLIGIRGRAFNPVEVARFGKYSPICVENVFYTHLLSQNLYGMNVVKENVARMEKVFVVESEKACMQARTMFGENNFTVATCGSAALSSAQINLLIKHGVREVIIGYDKEFIDGNEDMKKNYEEKLLRIAQPLTTIFDVSYVFDEEGLLPYKASPCDINKEVLVELMRHKKRVRSFSKEPMRDDRKKRKW